MDLRDHIREVTLHLATLRDEAKDCRKCGKLHGRECRVMSRECYK